MTCHYRLSSCPMNVAEQDKAFVLVGECPKCALTSWKHKTSTEWLSSKQTRLSQSVGHPVPERAFCGTFPRQDVGYLPENMDKGCHVPLSLSCLLCAETEVTRWRVGFTAITGSGVVLLCQYRIIDGAGQTALRRLTIVKQCSHSAGVEL